MPRALLITGLLLLHIFAKAQAPVFTVYEDKSREMQAPAVYAAFQEGRFKPLPSAFLNPGFTTSIFWIALTGVPPGQDWCLVADNAHINHLELYAVAGAPRLLHITGDFHPFAQRPLVHNTFVFPLQPVAPLYLLKVEKHHESLQAPLYLRTREQLQQQQVTDALANGIFTGIIVLIILFGCFLFCTTRDAVYGWYAIYVTSVLLWIWANKGLGFHYIWPGSSFFPSRSRPLFVFLNLILALQFITAYTGIRRSWPIRLFQGVWLVFVVLVLWPVPYTRFVEASMRIQQALPLFSMAAVLFVTYTLVRKALQKNRAALIYLVANVMLLVFVVLENLYHLGKVQLPSFVAHYGIFTGVALEMIIITFGLAARFSSYRKEKEAALVALNRQQKALTDTIVTVEEKERKALADRLHDELGAMLALTSLQVNAGKTEQAAGLLQEISHTVRTISHQLTPVAMEKYGFRHAVEDMVQQANASGQIHIELIIIGFTEDRQRPLNFLHTLYRLVQELLQNILKHAGAANVLIQLIEHDDSCSLMVEDNGKGMPPERAAPGLLRSVHAKVGYLEGHMNIDSTPGKGTIIDITLPLPEKLNS
ncbi:sensor histidine kinase [Chitinophaga lutea]|nr:7TM diverse intracellular signaling domain-containing protein [Chitinophaga lutea]